MARSGHQNYRRRVLPLALAVSLGALTHAALADAADNPFGDASRAPMRPISVNLKSTRARFEYHVLVGELALVRGDTAQAATAYSAALKVSHDAALAKRTTQIALAADRMDLAYRAAVVWAGAKPHDEQAQQAALRLAFVQKDADGMAHFAPTLVAAADSRRAGYETLAKILSDKPGQADMAIAVLRKLADAHPDDAAAAYALGRLALSYNRIDVAAKAAERATTSAPDWPDAALLRSAIDVRQAHFKVARKRIDALSGSKRDRAGYHVALAHMLLSAGKRDAGFAEFKQAVSIDPGFDDARYGLGVLALSKGALDAADAQFEKLYQQQSHASDAAFYLGVIAEQRDQLDKAWTWYKRVTDGDHVLPAQVHLAQLAYKQGDLPGARQRLENLADQYPEQSVRLHAMEGGLLLQANKPKQAVALYDKVLADAPDNADLLYARALAYARLGRIDDAEADLRNVLAQDSDNMEALNALGYMMTNHSTHYARAERYIRKSLKQDPDNPAVLDSLGWVEYKRGRLAAARQHLEKAYQASPDPEIAAHLGEVRWKQGDHDAARKIWHKAAAKYPDNAVLKKTIKRLSPRKSPSS